MTISANHLRLKTIQLKHKMAIIIKKAKSNDVWLTEPGEYRRGYIKDTNNPSAHMSCPACGKVASLSGHHISSTGVVTPSLVCFYNCGFHDYVQLEDWGGGEVS